MTHLHIFYVTKQPFDIDQNKQQKVNYDDMRTKKVCDKKIIAATNISYSYI